MRTDERWHRIYRYIQETEVRDFGLASVSDLESPCNQASVAMTTVGYVITAWERITPDCSQSLPLCVACYSLDEVTKTVSIYTEYDMLTARHRE